VAVSWNERFLVPLPGVLCEQLASPLASVDDEAREAFAGVPLTLRFLMTDNDRAAAPTLAAASAAITYDWLMNQVRLCCENNACFARSLSCLAVSFGQQVGQ
jgi:hypothetical protein